MWLELSFTFWIVSDFLQKPLAWFSKFYLRVQSKICGGDNFFSSFLIFLGFWAKTFSDFWPKNVENLSKLSSTSPEEQFVAWIFFKFWLVSDILQKLLAWFSKFYLRVQSKNCGKRVFFCFLFRIFSIFERKLIRLLALIKLHQVFKNYLLRVQRNSLWYEIFFLKFWTVLDFLQKPLAWFSKFYLRVQSKICWRNNFFVLPFWFFSDFERKDFQTFGQKMSRICQN